MIYTHNWFEVLLTEEGDWWKFDTFEEANEAFQMLVDDGEVVSLQRPANDWTEDNLSYEEIVSSDD